MLDENGFVRKSYNELLFDLDQKAKELFGSDINTAPHSVIGAFIRVIAWFLSLLYELVEKVYLSGFISQASGVSLDRLGANSGVYRNPSSFAVVELVFTGKENYTINEGVRFSTESKVMFEMIDEVTISSNGTGRGKAVSLETNVRANVPANTITVQVEPTEEITSVNNPNSAEGAMDQESDSELRERIRLSIRGNPGPPINGILTALLEVPGVRTASLVENNTSKVDRYDNPPKSIHVYISGGTIEDIGQALFSSIAAGIESVGEQVVSVKDIGGFAHEVRFDYSAAVEIFVSIKLVVDEKFEDDGKEQVSTTIINYINSLTMGSEVRYSYLYPLVYQIAGIQVADIKIGKSIETVKAEDISLNPYESAAAGMANVVVTVDEV